MVNKAILGGGDSGILPSYISNFNASDNLVGSVTVTFTPATGVPIPTHDLYENGVLVATNISSGYTRSVSAGVRSYYVKAVNSVGEVASNSNNGTSKAPAGSQTFTSSGTFVVPIGYSSVTICMVGGGGSGSKYVFQTCGGGRAGTIKSQAVAVTSGASITVTIGNGGSAVTGSPSNGNSGGTTWFGGISASGGGGGIYNSTTYAGNGASRSTCNGTKYDGSAYTNGYTSYGGQAGLGNGGQGGWSGVRSSGAGTYGGGGGAIIANDTTTPSGAGGKGYCKVSWS